MRFKTIIIMLMLMIMSAVAVSAADISVPSVSTPTDGEIMSAITIFYNAMANTEVS